MGDYQVKSGDNLYNIVKVKYGFKNKTDIMNAVNYLAKENNINRPNFIKVGQELKLPEQLRLQSIMLFNPDDKTSKSLNSNSTNYFRANDIFGDIATKPNEYNNQPYVESTLNNITKGTKDIVEHVVTNVKAFFTSDTARDEKMADIFAKQIGKWYKDGQEKSGGFKLEGTEAYKFACEVNADDWTERETEYKGKAENHNYLDRAKTDGKITLFSLEEVNGKEYFAMRNKDGEIHYFDRNDNLRDVTNELFK